jgi:uncharacterized iron-regulated membrane protein
LTGSTLVFYQEIDEWLNPELLTVGPPSERAPYRTPDEIFAAAMAAAPAGAELTFANYPRTRETAYTVTFSHERGDGRDVWDVLVDPYTAQVKGTRLIRSSEQWFSRVFVYFVFDLHINLLIPSNYGASIVGIVAILAILSITAGLVLWWPPPNKWRRAFGLRWRSSGQRLTYDLHQVFGIYPWLILLALLVSGIYFNLPGTFMAAVRTFSPETTDGYALSSAKTSGKAVTVGEAMAIADAYSPGGQTFWIYPAGDETGAYRIYKKGLTSINPVFHVRTHVIDQYSGKVLHTEDIATGTAGDAFIAWQWPLHSGQAFGMTGRILVLLTGLACVGLFVTGVLRWLHKRHARKRAVRFPPPA